MILCTPTTFDTTWKRCNAVWSIPMVIGTHTAVTVSLRLLVHKTITTTRNNNNNDIMKYLKLNSGGDMPIVGYGTWQVNSEYIIILLIICKMKIIKTYWNFIFEKNNHSILLVFRLYIYIIYTYDTPTPKRHYRVVSTVIIDGTHRRPKCRYKIYGTKPTHLIWYTHYNR